MRTTQEGEDYDLRIKKGLYGLKESPKLWWQHLHSTIMRTTTLKQCVFDECAYYGRDLILLIYVDDLLMLGKKQKINELVRILKKKFKITETALNEEVDFLGCYLRKGEDGALFLSQRNYLDKVLSKYASEVAEKDTPLPSNYDPMVNLKLPTLNATSFQERLGVLGYLRATRPDILHGVHQLAKFASKPTTYMFKSVNHLCGYLKKTRHCERVFYGNHSDSSLVAVVHAAFANASESGNLKLSTGGHFIYFGPSMVDAQSSTIHQAATSAPEAELYQLIKTTKTMIFLKGLLKDFGELKVQMALLTDSQSTVGTVNNPVSSRYKYLAAYITFIKSVIAREQMRVVFLRREYNFADIMTKQSSSEIFNRLWNMASSKFKWTHETKQQGSRDFKTGHGVRKMATQQNNRSGK